MTSPAAGGLPGTAWWAGRVSGWLRGSRGGLFAIALVTGYAMSMLATSTQHRRGNCCATE
jgi:hypothetical protein